MTVVALLLALVLVLLIVLCWEQRVEETETMVLQDSFFVLVGSDLDGYSFREQTVEKAIRKVELYLALCSLNEMLDESEIFVLYQVQRTAEIDFVSPIQSFCDHQQCSDHQRCQSL